MKARIGQVWRLRNQVVRVTGFNGWWEGTYCEVLIEWVSPHRNGSDGFSKETNLTENWKLDETSSVVEILSHYDV